jgi:hypothetical protein
VRALQRTEIKKWQTRVGLVRRHELLCWAGVEFRPLGKILKSHRRMTHDKLRVIALTHR